MVYRSLLLSDRYKLDYVEVGPTATLISGKYDFYFFNYHISEMGWLETQSLRNLPGLKITLVLEMLPNEPFVMCSTEDFDAYCVLDPTMNVADKRVYALPRPLEVSEQVSAPQESRYTSHWKFWLCYCRKGF